MSAGRDSFYSALESIIDNFSCVLFDSKASPAQGEDMGSGKSVWEEKRPLRQMKKYIQWAGQEFAVFGSSSGGDANITGTNLWQRKMVYVVVHKREMWKKMERHLE